MSSLRAVICGNGEWEDEAYLARIRASLAGGDLRIAADGGARVWRRLGLAPHALIGDFDSLTEDEVAAWEAAGVEIRRHPVAKDQSDVELALDYATRAGAGAVLLAAVTGSRLDHSLANLLLAARFAGSGREITVLTPRGAVYPVTGRAGRPGARHVPAAPGDVVALLPVGGPAAGVTTHNLRYPLRNAVLPWASTLPISNEPTASTVGVEVAEGSLLIIVEQGDGEVLRCVSRS
ncbi:MAG TPA: thiamine diphosphokinase [Bacillota bacterium]